MQFGRTYEEFEVGAVFKHWPGKTVTEYDDHLFCLLTMNHHPLHLDAHYAEGSTQFGRNVVVGNFVYSLLIGMSVPDVSGKAIANLEIESLKHVAPTVHGDTISGETTVLEKWESTSKDDRGIVHVETRGYNQDGVLVCVFRSKVMVPKRSYLDTRRRASRAARPHGRRPGLARRRRRYADPREWGDTIRRHRAWSCGRRHGTVDDGEGGRPVGRAADLLLRRGRGHRDDAPGAGPSRAERRLGPRAGRVRR
jgi:acyl dehydratase